MYRSSMAVCFRSAPTFKKQIFINEYFFVRLDIFFEENNTHPRSRSRNSGPGQVGEGGGGGKKHEM